MGATDPLNPVGEPTTPIDILGRPPAPASGGFHPVGRSDAVLHSPRALAIDEDGRLFVAESGAGRILIYDLWEGSLIRKVRLAEPGSAGPRPIDLACDGRRVFALLETPPGLVVLNARADPRPCPLPEGLENPSRIALEPGGDLYFLADPGTESARVMPRDRPDDVFSTPQATDLAFSKPGVLVVARRPGMDFLQLVIRPGSQDLLPPLKGRDYDGRGIVRTPDGRIGFWTRRGFRHAVAARTTYNREGRVTSFRLDSGQFQTTWGRLFLDACIPRGTEVRVHCAAADEPPDGATLDSNPPANTVLAEIHRPDLSPPMPPVSLLPRDASDFGPLHRRESGRELPWTRREDLEPFETYEAPVRAAPGRYLWVTLLLRGDTRSTPRVRSLRVEYPSHQLLRHLPRIYSEDEPAADFLRRYLAIFEGHLADLGTRAFARRALLDPRSTPAEFLPWLAGFLGLVLDERWPVPVKRRLIAEAADLFRLRGTVPGLKRFLEIYLGRAVVLIEHFRVRGLGGAYVGEGGPLASRSVLGAGFRVGGAVGTIEEVAVGDAPPTDAFALHAHRFSVVIPASLSREQRDVVRHILDVHRPAHTQFDLCLVDAGMRAGLGLYAGLTTVVGHAGGWTALQVGGSWLGRGGVIGRPGPGVRVGGGRLGRDSRSG